MLKGNQAQLKNTIAPRNDYLKLSLWTASTCLFSNSKMQSYMFNRQRFSKYKVQLQGSLQKPINDNNPP